MGKLEKIPAWQETKVRNKKEVIDEARSKGRKVQFATLMDLCHLENSELEAPYQKYKGRVVLRFDIVKDDSGSCTVFAEQRSLASQMTAAKVMDIISRLPGCSGQAADAVSAKTEVKMEDASTLSKKFQRQNVQTFGHVYRSTNGPKSWSSMEDPVVPLERNLYGHLWQDYCGKGNFENVLLEHDWEKVLKLGKRTDLISVCGRYQTGRKTENIKPTWKIIVANYRDMIEARISAGAMEKLPIRASGKPDAATTSSWSYDMEGHAKKCVER